MGLISKTVMMKWNGRNIKWYKSKGYIYTKQGENFEIKVEDLPNKSNTKVKLICDNCGKEMERPWILYKGRVHEDNKYYCSSCGNKLFAHDSFVNNRLNKGDSFEKWCIENNRIDLLDNWDYELNDKKPSEILHSIHSKFWFKCPRGIHESELKSITDLTSNKILNLCKKCKSFEQWCIENNRQDVLDRWDYELNDKLPDEISYTPIEKYWFKCPCGKHPSELKNINCFTSGQEGSIRCNMCRSFAQWGIDNICEDFLEKYWDYEKNNKLGIEPWLISFGSHKKFWIKCNGNKEHNSYYANCYDFVDGCRCPKCKQERSESYLEEKVRLYLESLIRKNNQKYIKLLHEHNCTIIPRNPKTKQKLPFDNELIFSDNIHLIIEVHGSQHYKESTGYFDKSFDLHKRQLYDRYKKIYIKSQGYYYLEIPYYTDNKKETWKTLINNEINQINNTYMIN